MKKIALYALREDEKPSVEHYIKELGCEVVTTTETPNEESIKMAKGCECAAITASKKLTPEILDAFGEQGIKFISSRSIGYDHIDVAYAKKIGITVANISYAPDSVADFAIMSMMMLLRKFKTLFTRTLVQDFSPEGVRGALISSKTVGILGAGNIGRTVARHLTGFGCKIIAYDPYPIESDGLPFEYVTLERLFAESDIITLHIPGSEATRNILNKAAFEKMKDGVLIVNTARGLLIEPQDLIDALTSGKVGGAALDVIENDQAVFFRNMKGEVINHKYLNQLISFPNVIYTPHLAYLTEETTHEMIKNTLLGCTLFMEKKEVPWVIKIKE